MAEVDVGERASGPGPVSPRSADAGPAAAAHLAVGTRAEVRAKNVDELYYAATVEAYDVETNSYAVLYDDGDSDAGILRSSMLVPLAQTTVLETELLVVVDGHVHLCGVVRRARLLAFKASPQLFQSAIVFLPADPLAEPPSESSSESEGLSSSPSFDYRILAFDVDQAIMMCLPLIRGLRAAAESELESESKSESESEPAARLRVCLMGAGGGSLIMSMLAVDPGVHMDVVELSEEVLAVAHSHFGVPPPGVDARLDLHVADGLDFLVDRQGGYDVVVVDVAASPEAGEGSEGGGTAELPPPQFLEEEFLCGSLRRSLAPDGWAVMNVLADRAALLVLLARAERAFGSVHLLATDPNYVFFLGNAEPPSSASSALLTTATATRLHEWAAAAGFADVSSVVLPQVANTAEALASGTLLGWFSVDEARCLLQNPDAKI